MNRSKDWLEQACSNLAHAELSLNMGHFAWACFAAQQAAEAAVKGLHLRLGQTTWGHSVLDLLSELPEAARPPAALLDRGKTLDKHYIPARYPDAHPSGSAARYYTERDAREAVEAAREVVTFCERQGLEG